MKWKIRFIIIGILFLIIGLEQNRLDASDLSNAVKIAKKATIGILRYQDDSTIPSNFLGFSVRGSGIHIGEGYILTAHHAVEHKIRGKTVLPKKVNVITSELKELPAIYIGANTFLDISIYKITERIDDSILTTARFSQTKPSEGQEVFTVGYPLGWGPALSFGRLGNTNTFLRTIESRLLQVDLSTCSGNSGGGLFNDKGEILGIIHAIIQTETTKEERRCSHFTFAIPGLMIHKVTSALISGKAIKFSKLGLELTIIKQGYQWSIAVKNASPPARQFGFKKGDILLSIDSHPIHSAAELKIYLIEHTKPGQQVKMEILRGKTLHNLNVILGKS